MSEESCGRIALGMEVCLGKGFSSAVTGWSFGGVGKALEQIFSDGRPIIVVRWIIIFYRCKRGLITSVTSRTTIGAGVEFQTLSWSRGGLANTSFEGTKVGWWRVRVENLRWELVQKRMPAESTDDKFNGTPSWDLRMGRPTKWDFPKQDHTQHASTTHARTSEVHDSNQCKIYFLCCQLWSW